MFVRFLFFVAVMTFTWSSCGLAAETVDVAQPSIAQAQAPAAPATGTVQGQVNDSGGTAIAGAQVTATGPVTRTAVSDASGAFVLTLPPGLYQITARKAGFNPATYPDFTVLGGGQGKVTVSLTAATLSSLREIGRVTVSTTSGARFNTTPASVQTISGAKFSDEGTYQVQRVLDQTPGIVIDHPGTNATNASFGAISFPSIRGGLGFETASLIDGHPLAVQTFGDYVTTFLVTDVLQNVELIKGPGAAAPSVNYAIGGTVNFRTLDPTRDPAGYVRQSYDSYGGLSTAARFTGSFLNDKKLGVALAYVIFGTPGALVNANNYVTLGSSSWQLNGLNQTGFTTNGPPGSSTNGNQNNPFYYRSSALGCCLPVNQNYNNRTELAKLRYSFSGATSATVSYLGSQTYTDQNGNHVYNFVTQFQPASGYAGSVAPGGVSTWQSVFFPANEWEYNNEPIFQGEVHSTFRGDSILARYYTASISRLQYNSLSDPNASYNGPLTLYGSAQTCPAVGELYNGKVCSNPATPALTDKPVTQIYNGQTVNITIPGAYFRSTEHDLLHGGSLEYDHFFGASGNVLSGSFNQVSSTTDSFSLNGNAPPSVSIFAGSREILTTGLLRYIGNLTDKLNLTLSNYINAYEFRTQQQNGGPLQTTTLSHYDARLGLAYRYSSNIALRASAGSAIAPPYLALLEVGPSSQIPRLSTDRLSATNTIGNPNIKPETSFGYDGGADFRLSQDGFSNLTLDGYYTNLWGQFIQPVVANGQVTLCTTGSAPPCPTGTSTVTVPLFSSQYQNLGQSRYAGFEAAYTRDPTVGVGYVAQGALIRAYPVNPGPCTYASTIVAGVLSCTGTPTTNLGVVNNANFYGNGTSGTPGGFNAINNHAIPYAQGYGEIHYRTEKGGYLAFGIQYYGNNNSLNVPAFWSSNATLRLVFPEQIFFQASVQNLNAAYRAPWISPFGGQPVPLVNGKLGLSNANTLGPAYWTFSLQKNV